MIEKKAVYNRVSKKGNPASLTAESSKTATNNTRKIICLYDSF
jgi:hypothetical protein